MDSLSRFGSPSRSQTAVAKQNPHYRLIFRPVFVAFLLLGPFAVLPATLLLPTLRNLSEAWCSQPAFWWRAAVIVAISMGLMAAGTIPSLLPQHTPPSTTIGWLVASQLPLMTAAACFSAMAMPLSLCLLLRRHSAHSRKRG